MAVNDPDAHQKPTRDQLLASVFDLPWISLDPETDRGQHGLAILLLHRLGHYLPDEQRTVAQLLIDLMLDRANNGHFPSLDQILIRIDGDTKSIEPAAKVEKTSFAIDEFTAQRVLDAVCQPGEGPSGH
jgi:hypothetical protein